MQGGALLERGAQGAVQAVLEVVASAPEDDVGEEVAVEGGVVGEQVVQVERALGRRQLLGRTARGGTSAQSRGAARPWAG